MDDQRRLVYVRLETAGKLSEAKAYPLASTTSCVGCESTSRAKIVFSDLSKVRVLGILLALPLFSVH